MSESLRAQSDSESRAIDPSSGAAKLALALYEHNMLGFQSYDLHGGIAAIEELQELEAMGWRFVPPEVAP